MSMGQQPSQGSTSLPTHRLAFVTEWQHTVLAEENKAQAAEKTAVEFAQSIIKTGLLLNGGGLIALPVAIQLFNVTVSNRVSEIFAASSFFIGGLLTSWVCNLCAYFAVVYLQNSLWSSREAIAQRLQVFYGFIPANVGQPSATQSDLTRQRHHRTYNRLRYVGIFFSLLTMLFFIGGALFGAYVLYDATDKNEAKRLNPSATMPIDPSAPAESDKIDKPAENKTGNREQLTIPTP